MPIDIYAALKSAIIVFRTFTGQEPIVRVAGEGTPDEHLQLWRAEDALAPGGRFPAITVTSEGWEDHPSFTL